MSKAKSPTPLVSVLMPTWGEASMIARAIASVQAQSMADWELLIIDDASIDHTQNVVNALLEDRRIRYTRLEVNRGLGACLNVGLDACRAPCIAYLPADDLYHRHHLERLLQLLDRHRAAVLAYSGVRHDYNRYAEGAVPEHGLQLVQCMHRRTLERWLERETLVSDDLERLFWHRLATPAQRVASASVSCEWVAHAHKLHTVLREPVGGLNTYRSRFGVSHPLRFHTTTGNPIDEVALYRHYRERPSTPMAADGLKIVLVGELAYNADRVLAIEELGHRLYGLWMDQPYWYNSVGPMPFGHVVDVPRRDWKKSLRTIRPDVIYALLNWQTVPFAHHVLTENPGIPFIWHFKEGPFICLEKGSWNLLIDLYRHCDGLIHVSRQMRDWLATVLPGSVGLQPELILDGDLPKRDWFECAYAPRISERDGALHTVVPGRPIGLHPDDVANLAGANIHLHFYGDYTHGQWREWIAKSLALAPGHLHLHPHVDIDRWVSEFSQYDAGWLHFFKSTNQGDLRRATWDDLNLPARMATLAAAGLPMLQRNNRGHEVAAQTQVRELGAGLFFDDIANAGEALRDRQILAQARDNLDRRRLEYTFDQHAQGLIDFMRQVIAHCGEGHR